MHILFDAIIVIVLFSCFPSLVGLPPFCFLPYPPGVLRKLATTFLELPISLVISVWFNPASEKDRNFAFRCR
uniref:Secreted protein n=1 Tax=Heterorhabditis bacteriophora TaxID=37862 RepID=A0A1I7WWV2_HETBA